MERELPPALAAATVPPHGRQGARARSRGAQRWCLTGLLALLLATPTGVPHASERDEVLRQMRMSRERRVELLRALAALGESDAKAPPLPRPRPVTHLNPLAADLRYAPPPPRDERARRLPDEAFDLTLGAPNLNGRDASLVFVRRVDADGDGRYEEIQVLDPDRKTLLRKRADRNRDGRIDCWKKYRDGRLVEQALDTNFNGRPDLWERYALDHTIAQRIDGDEDGRPDVFLFYDDDRLVREDRDRDGDGAIDVRSIYRDGKLVRREFLSPESF
ncbi:MAG: hypothetical protein ACE5FG_03230 [Myxococcota bacterium]